MTIPSPLDLDGKLNNTMEEVPKTHESSVSEIFFLSMTEHFLCHIITKPCVAS